MSRYESKFMVRSGGQFKNERGTVAYDLTDLKFLHTGVDTIRQLYTCDLKQDIVEQLTTHFDKTTSDTITIGGIDWLFKKSGSSSGYQFNLKNLELGFVVLLKSFYIAGDERGTHIKIECTPQVIDDLGLSKLTDKLRSIASIFGDTIEASSVACHICCDMKGLVIPENFEANLVTRSKRNLSVKGISNAHFEAAAASFVYNRGETFMFGSSNQLQMCLYNKSLQASKTDNLAFYEHLWKQTPAADLDRFPDPEYRDGRDGEEPDEVWRLEFRFHQNIIKEFENGNFNATGNQICIREARDLIKHLNGLWQYALNNFRLQHSTTYIHPIWQLLIEDVTFRDFHKSFIYKRSQKKSDSPSSRRNVALFLGNHLKLASRLRLRPPDVVNSLLSLGFDSYFSDYFGLRQYGESDLLFAVMLDFVTKKMTQHALDGVAA